MRRVGSVPAGGRGGHAVFFALYPPRESADEIEHFVDGLFDTGVLRGKRVARERLHITLNALGGFETRPKTLIAKACAALADWRHGRFTLALNRVTSFDNKDGRPRVISGEDGLIGIDRLYDDIYLQLRRAGLRLPHQRIVPHLTLSREASLLPEDYIDPLVWSVTDVRLIDSLHGESRHEILGNWPLV